jgi:hypothetical protein
MNKEEWKSFVDAEMHATIKVIGMASKVSGNDFPLVKAGLKDWLESEIGWLKGVLAEMPEDDVIDRQSFEARLRKAESELAEAAADGGAS